MNPYEEEEKRRLNGQNLLSVTEEAEREDRSPKARFSEVFKKLPVKNLVLGGLIICACFIGLALSERISGIGADVDQFKIQLKSQVGDLESRLAVSVRENEQFRKELASVKTELEAIRVESQKRLAQEARAATAKKANAAAKKQKRKP